MVHHPASTAAEAGEIKQTNAAGRMRRVLAVVEAHRHTNTERRTVAIRAPGAILSSTNLLPMEEWGQATILSGIRRTSLILTKRAILEHTDERTSGAKIEGRSGQWVMTTSNSSRRHPLLGILL